MKKIWTPRDYQRAMRDFALDSPRTQWWAGTGTGKTSAWLAVIDLCLMFGDVTHVLIVTTKNIATIVWPQELQKWENFSHLTMAVAVGTPEQRMAALKKRAHITCINVENVPWLMEALGDHWFFDMVIADESTKLKNMRIDTRVSKLGREFDRKSGGSVRAFELGRVAHKKINRWINGTGTPLPNGLLDLWGQAWFIDAGARLGRTFSSYQERWFNSVRVDTYKTIVKPTPFAEEQIKGRLADVTITIDARDYMDLPPIEYNVISVPLPPKARSHYREMEKDFFTQVQEHEIEAVSSGAKMMKLRQLASGAAYHDDEANFVEVFGGKLDFVEDILGELNGGSLIVAYQFKSDLARLQKRFPNGHVFNAKNKDAFQRGEFPLLFVHPASAGHGIDGLQDVCHHMVMFSQTWNLEEFEQVIERIGPTRQVSAGFWRTTFVHLLIGEDTIEEEMYERTQSKASVQDAVKAAMKKRGLK